MKSTDLSGQLAHYGECGHVERHSSPRLERRLLQLVAAPHHVPWPTRSLYNEAIVIQLLQHVTNGLSDALKEGGDTEGSSFACRGRADLW